MCHIDNLLESAYSYHQLTKEGVMPHTQILTGPDSTKRILANLSLAIDEARLVRDIVSLSDQLRLIEFLPEQADRARFIKKNIINLEGQLSDVREQAL